MDATSSFLGTSTSRSASDSVSFACTPAVDWARYSSPTTNELRREVALKQIQDHHADDTQTRARFLQEAEITGSLEHPGIIPVYGLGRYTNGRPFYAMRFVKGVSLREAITEFHAVMRDAGSCSR